MPTVHTQRGMTFIGLLLTLSLIAFFALITFRLLPMYIEYFNIATSLESLTREPELATKSSQEIQSLLSKRFEVNNVEHVNAKNVLITRNGDGLVVRVKYEVRKELIANLDIVGKFDRSIEARVH